MLPLKPVSFTRLTAAFSTSSRVFVLLSQQLGSVLFGNPKIGDLQLYCACLVDKHMTRVLLPLIFIVLNINQN